VKALLALAAIAVVVIALRPRRPAPLPESDDSEGLLVPMTWSWAEDNAHTYGPGWWVEFAPTSRN